jgi:hypothetical protein
MHPCSCVIRLGQKALARLLGEALTVECDEPDVQRYRYWADNGILETNAGIDAESGDFVRWEDVLDILGAKGA